MIGAECWMVLELTIFSILSFTATTLLLLVYTVLDLRTRRVPNRLMIIGAVAGLVIVILTGHLAENAILHLSAGIFTTIVAYILFRVGAFGGADTKAVVTIAILSPGIEFSVWSEPVLEAIVASGTILVFVLLGAYIYSLYKKRQGTSSITPILPIMLVAYLMMQLLAMV
jgi:Flp pilus assembly protein protease CpaA